MVSLQQSPKQVLTPPNSSQPPTQAHRPSRPYLGYCQICRLQGHTAKWCPSFRLVPINTSNSNTISPSPALPNHSATSWQPRAHYASNTLSTTSWILDSGASHHVIADLNNLSLHAPYNGSYDIMIGDGSGLSITHIGSTSLPTTHNTFQLTNVLYVPTMKKNRISISQICTSNNVSIEFLPTAFLVKDIHTGETLLQGQTKMAFMSGRYLHPCLHSPSSKQLYLSGIKD